MSLPSSSVIAVRSKLRCLSDSSSLPLSPGLCRLCIKRATLSAALLAPRKSNELKGRFLHLTGAVLLVQMTESAVLTSMRSRYASRSILSQERCRVFRMSPQETEEGERTGRLLWTGIWVGPSPLFLFLSLRVSRSFILLRFCANR